MGRTKIKRWKNEVLRRHRVKDVEQADEVQQEKDRVRKEGAKQQHK